MQDDIEKILVSREAIAQRVREVAQQVVDDTPKVDDDQHAELLVIPILTGALIFLADLIREVPIHTVIKMMTVSSYPGTATSSKGARIEQSLTNLPADLTGKHVVVIDDILDSGQTLNLVREQISLRNPASLRMCVLLRKVRPEAMATPVDYVCFDIPDEFVVGYGLDFDDRYRNLPEIAVLQRGVIERAQTGA